MHARILTQWEEINEINKMLKVLADLKFKPCPVNSTSFVHLGQIVLPLCTMEQHRDLVLIQCSSFEALLQQKNLYLECSFNP
jgi:hypothetical protein